jgi:hypothetical protein
VPIVDGRYEAKISTTYATAEEGVEEIKKKVQKSRRLRINSIPMALLKELMPYLKNKDLKIILSLGEKPTEDLKELGSVATSKARIYVDCIGREANSGSISFSDRFFSIIWLKEEILSVPAMEYSKCAKCMTNSFEGGWHYSQKS